MERIQSLRCNECSRTFSFIGNNPLKDEIEFCPTCGSRNIKVSSKSLDYWQELSKSTRVPVELLKEMFSLWIPEECPSFLEYVKTFTKEVA